MKLSKDNERLVASLLCESTSIRTIERLTRIHRDTVLRHLVKVGAKCQNVLDAHMRDLCLNALEIDEVWTFLGKKERSIRPDDPLWMGDCYVYIATCPQSKIVPHFEVGKRSEETTFIFLEALAHRLAMPCQVATDGYHAYRHGVPAFFGKNADFMMIIKSFGYNHPDDERRYSAPAFAGVQRKWISGVPKAKFASTSRVEAQNAGLRTNVKRLTRLTRCFSRKPENLKAALSVHFAAYNLMRAHRGLKGEVPGVAAGLIPEPMTVNQLLAA